MVNDALRTLGGDVEDLAVGAGALPSPTSGLPRGARSEERQSGGIGAKPAEFLPDQIRGFSRLPVRVQELLSRGLVVDYDVARDDAIPRATRVSLYVVDEDQDGQGLTEAVQAARWWHTVQKVVWKTVQKLTSENGLNQGVVDEIERSLQRSLNSVSSARDGRPELYRVSGPQDVSRRAAPPGGEPRSLAMGRVSSPAASSTLPAPEGFWDSLSRTQQRDLAALGAERTFAAGARLMTQGEFGDHVVVIRSGRVEISVGDNAAERVIARRGPGDLIGERAVLQVNVRSATVVASETVCGLVVKTEEFARFLSSNPGVLDIVERQIYDRLTEQDYVAPAPPGWLRNQPALAGENCTVVNADVVGFGASSRSDRDRLLIRQSLFGIMSESLSNLSPECSVEDRGDGFLIVVPPTVPTGRVVAYLHRALPARLARHNRVHRESVHIQLRTAVDVGPITSDPFGLNGSVIVNTARLLSSRELKERISATGSDFGIIASDFVYSTAVKSNAQVLDPKSYLSVKVRAKESNLAAWMKVWDTTSSQSLVEAELPVLSGQPAMAPATFRSRCERHAAAFS